MEQLRKDSKSKEKKKSVIISSPVGDIEQLQQHCRVLEYTNEVGMFHTLYIYMYTWLRLYTYLYIYMYRYVYGVMNWGTKHELYMENYVFCSQSNVFCSPVHMTSVLYFSSFN